MNGRISGTINGVEFLARDLQCYVQTKDGRTYTALSRVPEEIGASFQLLGNLGGVIGWLFAKPIGETKNGYELTGRERLFYPIPRFLPFLSSEVGETSSRNFGQ